MKKLSLLLGTEVNDGFTPVRHRGVPVQRHRDLPVLQVLSSQAQGAGTLRAVRGTAAVQAAHVLRALWRRVILVLRGPAQGLGPLVQGMAQVAPERAGEGQARQAVLII